MFDGGTLEVHETMKMTKNLVMVLNTQHCIVMVGFVSCSTDQHGIQSHYRGELLGPRKENFAEHCLDL